VNNEADNVGADPPFSVEELYALAQANQDHVVLAQCTIDGRPVQGLEDPINTPYRVQSPVFSFTLPDEDNLYQFFGFDVSGTIEPAVADGIFLMLAPLSVGEHTIHFWGRLLFTEETDGFDLDYNLDIAYHVTVQP
jgi:hypothetical protein